MTVAAHPCKIQGCGRLGRVSYHKGIDKSKALRVCNMHAGRWQRHGSYFAHKCRQCGDVVDDEEALTGNGYRCSACLLKEPNIDQDRLLAGRERGARRGVFQGRTPFGYISVDRRLAVDPVEAEAVKTIFKTYLSARSSKRVVAALIERGMVQRTGKPWSRQTVVYVLRNPVYRGIVKFGGRSYHGSHEPIVTPIEFNLVQKILGRKR